MKRYTNFWKIYSLPLWKIKLLYYCVDLILWHRALVRAHWVGSTAQRMSVLWPERAKFTIRIFGYRLILWLSLQSQTE